jgi:rare lipoprotein A (peptidoglycan hydrolase)
MRLVLLIAAVCAVMFAVRVHAESKLQVSCFDSSQRLAGQSTPNPHHYPVVAAHKDVPFGTIIEFFKELGGARTKFIVKDRGPFVKGRTYDIDCDAGRKAGFPDLGWLYAHVLGRE